MIYDDNNLRRFEEISNNAWPALHTMLYDGWVLRFACGVTKRSNSVSLLYPSTLGPEEKIDYCEEQYLAQAINPCFKITSIARPGDIDKRLDKRGYFIHSYVSFQVLDITCISGQPIRDIQIETEFSESWIGHFIRMNEFDLARKPVYVSIMKRLSTPRCLVSLVRDRKTIGVGLGVLDGMAIGLFDIVVSKEFRNTGLGYLIVDNILRWGRNKGATTAYLQVLTENAPALHLYEKMGFRELYQYWYRMKSFVKS